MGALKYAHSNLFTPMCEMMKRWLIVQVTEILGYANLVIIQIFQLYTSII